MYFFTLCSSVMHQMDSDVPHAHVNLPHPMANLLLHRFIINDRTNARHHVGMMSHIPHDIHFDSAAVGGPRP